RTLRKNCRRDRQNHECNRCENGFFEELFLTHDSSLITHHFPCPVIRAIASARVRESLRNPPSTADVTVCAPDFFAPRNVMQVCSASTTTITPSGFNCS